MEQYSAQRERLAPTVGKKKTMTVTLLMLSSERSQHDCAIAKNSNADRISAVCFTACPRTGILLSSDDTPCNFALGLSPQILAKSSAVLSIEKHVLWLQIPKDDVPVVQGLQSKKQ